MNDELAHLFPSLNQLIENGQSGAATTFGADPLSFGTLYTGASPEQHNLLNQIVQRIDGLNVGPITRHHLGTPFVWDLLDANGVSCAVINMSATFGTQARTSNIFSDVLFREQSKDPADISTLPGAVFPIEKHHQILCSLWHPNLVGDDEVRAILNEANIQNEEKANALRAALCEIANVQSIALEALGSSEIEAIFCCYDPIGTLLNKSFGSLTNKQALNLFSFVDTCIGNLISFAKNTSFCVTGGGENPFLILNLPQSTPDSLLSCNSGIFDFTPTVLSHFQLNSEGLEGKPIYPNETVANAFVAWEQTQKEQQASFRALLPFNTKSQTDLPIPRLQKIDIEEAINAQYFNLAEYFIHRGRQQDAEDIMQKHNFSKQQSEHLNMLLEVN